MLRGGVGDGEGERAPELVRSEETRDLRRSTMVDVPSYFRLDDQVAVITGGASGIGESTAQVLSSAGAAVVVADLDEEGAARTAKQIVADGGRAISVGANTAKQAEVDAVVDRAVKEFGQLDIMCNVAGVGYAKPVVDITEADFDRVMGINLKGVLFGCQAALRQMIPRKTGAIVNVASTAIDTPAQTMGLYGMSKAGVAYLSQVLGVEASAHGIRVNCIAPGATPTNFASHRYEGGKIDPVKEQEFKDMMAKMTPLGFQGEAIDQALLILYLVSPAARWAAGNIWRVNGGSTRPW
jgi:3-oxoacyl-[acyl-carrier protein] reductase